MIPGHLCFSALSAEEIEDRLEEKGEFSPTFGFVFSSVALDIKKIADILASAHVPVFGASTAGEILGVDGEDPVRERSAVCCFLDIDPSLFSIRLFDRGERSCFEFGEAIGVEGTKLFREPAFIIAISGLSNDGDAIVSGIRSAVPPGTPVVGGLAGDDSFFRETCVFSQEGCSTNGAVALIFDRSRVTVQNVVTCGWTGIGADMMVTKSEGNVLHSINGRPATEVFGEYLNVPDDQLVEVAVTFPLQIRRPDGTVVLRTGLSADFQAGSITFAGTVPQGASVRFSSCFGAETIEESVRDIGKCHDLHPAADMVLAFSCMARHWAAGSLVNDELKAALDLWRRPLIGFFSYGEIGHTSQGTCDFHNESLSLAIITFSPDVP